MNHTSKQPVGAGSELLPLSPHLPFHVLLCDSHLGPRTPRFCLLTHLAPCCLPPTGGSSRETGRQEEGGKDLLLPVRFLFLCATLLLLRPAASAGGSPAVPCSLSHARADFTQPYPPTHDPSASCTVPARGPRVRSVGLLLLIPELSDSDLFTEFFVLRLGAASFSCSLCGIPHLFYCRITNVTLGHEFLLRHLGWFPSPDWTTGTP